MAPTDARFARLQTDPRFRRPKQKAVKAEIDERFKDVLSADFGKVGGAARVDKRGRPLASSHNTDEMKRFYRLKSPEEGEDRIDYARGEGALESSGSEDEGSDESDVEEEELEIGGKRRVRYDLPPMDSDSESDADRDSDDNGQLKVDLSEGSDDEGVSAFPPEADEEYEESDEEDEPGVDPTTRIAVVNLDWDNLRADDLFTIFNSFLKPSARKGEAAQPAPGKLLNVRIYPSEFGKERMALEDAAGPGGGIFKAPLAGVKKGKKRRVEVEEEEEDEGSEGDDEGDEEMSVDGDEQDGDESEGEHDEDEDEEEDDNASSASLEDDGLDAEIDNLEILSDVESRAGSEEIDMDKLRQYQLERLRYYYAIATFSTVAAAEVAHDELNGTEFERTANILDLSYVPEDMTFEEDDVADEATKEPKGYKGTEFVTDALRHSKVKLTWDQDDPNRAKITRRALTREEIDEQDFANLVAASSDEDADDDDEEEAEEADGKSGKATDASTKKKSKKERIKERKAKLRELLLAADDDTGDIWGKAGTSWQDELADIKADAEGKKSNSKKAKADAVEITFRPGLSVTATADDENLTTLEKYQRRMKEKKAAKKERAELRRAGRGGEDGEEKSKPDEDDFFGADEDEPEPEAPKSKSKGKDAKTKASKSDDLADFTPVDMDDPAGLVGDASHHFNLKDALAAEKDEAKKRKRHRNKKKGKAAQEPELGPAGFDMAAAASDPRFGAVYDEAAFAIDPTHPKFADTQANRAILQRTREEHAAKREGKRAAAAGGDGAELGDLVASVKRKMEGAGGKRKRSRKH